MPRSHRRFALAILLTSTTASADEHEVEHDHAHSPFELRASIEAPIVGHASGGSTNITKESSPSST